MDDSAQAYFRELIRMCRMEPDAKDFLTDLLMESGKEAQARPIRQVKVERLRGEEILESSDLHSYPLLIEMAAKQGLIELSFREVIALRLMYREKTVEEQTRVVMRDLTGQDFGIRFSQERYGSRHAPRISLFTRHQRLFKATDFWFFRRV